MAFDSDVHDYHTESDVEMAPCATNTFTVVYISTDKDSGRSSPDTDDIDTPPPVSLQQPTHALPVTSQQPTLTEHNEPSSTDTSACTSA